jgi:hypothetical protein
LVRVRIVIFHQYVINDILIIFKKQPISGFVNQQYEFVNGKDDIPYMKCKIKAMFETTNQ